MVREGASSVGVMAVVPVHWCSVGGRAELSHGQKETSETSGWVRDPASPETVRGSLRQL